MTILLFWQLGIHCWQARLARIACTALNPLVVRHSCFSPGKGPLLCKNTTMLLGSIHFKATCGALLGLAVKRSGSQFGFWVLSGFVLEETSIDDFMLILGKYSIILLSIVSGIWKTMSGWYSILKKFIYVTWHWLYIEPSERSQE